MTTTNTTMLAFPSTTLTPIADSQNRPPYASLRVTQTELNGNTASVHSNLGDGLRSHLALTIPQNEYLVLTNNVQFIAPINLAAQLVHPANATGNQITEINRQHIEHKQVFKTYHDVDQALCNQIIATIPDVYI
jgi:hypothetical protein